MFLVALDKSVFIDLPDFLVCIPDFNEFSNVVIILDNAFSNDLLHFVSFFVLVDYLRDRLLRMMS